MRNTYRDFHPDTPLETIRAFIFKVALPTIIMCVVLTFVFYCPKAKGQELLKNDTIIKDSVSSYFLVQHYIKDLAIDTGIPHKLFCVGKSSKKNCTMFVGANKVNNFFATGKCVQIYSLSNMIEYDCGGNAKKRVMTVDQKLHDFFLKDLLVPKQDNKNL